MDDREDGAEGAKSRIRDLMEDVRKRDKELREQAGKIDKNLEAREAKQRQLDEISVEINKRKEDIMMMEKAEKEHTKDTDELEKNRYRAREVKVKLVKYVPRLAGSIQEDGTTTNKDAKDDKSGKDGEKREGEREGEKTEGGDATKAEDKPETAAKFQHNFVLVSYVNAGAGMEDYQVGYRIDRTITVGQLHRDACAYWGCSHMNYILCKIGSDDKATVTPLWDPPEQVSPDQERGMERQRAEERNRMEEKKNVLLQEKILKPEEKAQLHLVQIDHLKKFKEEADKYKDKAPFPIEVQAQSKVNDPTAIKTMKHGLVTTEKAVESWVEALKPWPGVYHLLRNRHRASGERKWARVRLADFVIWALLIIFSIVIISLRYSGPDKFLLRDGVVQTLGVGIPGETSGTDVSFSGIQVATQAWAWIQGPLHYQLWNENSTLRRFYTPLGMLRIRNQKAGKVKCSGRELPEWFEGQECFSLQVDDATQYRGSLVPEFADELQRYYNQTGNSAWETDPFPFEWTPVTPPESDLYGRMQTYGGGGYSALYNMSKPVTSESFSYDMQYLSEVWVDFKTRLIVLELTLANHHLGGFVSVNVLFENSASGSISPMMDVSCFNVFDTAAIKASNVIDWIRAAITILWVGGVRLYLKTKERLSQGRSSFAYIMTFSGVIDCSIVGLTAALKYMSMKGPFPDPMKTTAFQNFLLFGSAERMCFIMEATLMLILIVKFTTLTRFSPPIFRFFKLFTRSVRMFFAFAFVFVPLLFGSAYAAHTIWSPYVFSFSDWSQAFAATMLGTYQPMPHALRMEATGRGWAIPFLIYFFLSTKVFAVHAFLAITVHAWFEVELAEGADATKESWSADQYLDWALWPAVYETLRRKKPGSSRQEGYVEAEEASDSDSSSSSDEDQK
mmetsp:Transcript_36022/g.103606  ORF Transcript_36022/g.103606 Transcript_36022/m.103606 type:complete len:903 (+) Transcript_36022:233-2941(+)